MLNHKALGQNSCRLMNSVWFCVSRSGRRSLSALLRLFGRFVLRPSLLDSHLQAGAAGGTGLHATPPEREPRPGAVPALPLRQRTQLPNAARARRADVILAVVFIITDGGSGQVQVRLVLFLVSPLLPPHFTAVIVFSKVDVVVSGGKDETSCLPEKLRRDG